MKEKLYREIQINPGWPPLKTIWNLTALDCHLCVLPWIARNGDLQWQAFLQEVQEAHRCLSIHWSLLLLEFLGCWYSMSFIGSSSHQQSIRISILIHVVFSNICFTHDTRDRSYTAMSKWLIRLRAGSGKPTTNNHRRSWKRATAISWSRAANRQSESPPMVSWRHLPTPWDIRGRFTNLQFVGKLMIKPRACVLENIFDACSLFLCLQLKRMSHNTWGWATLASYCVPYSVFIVASDLATWREHSIPWYCPFFIWSLWPCEVWLTTWISTPWHSRTWRLQRYVQSDEC